MGAKQRIIIIASDGIITISTLPYRYVPSGILPNSFRYEYIVLDNQGREGEKPAGIDGQS